MEGEFTEEQIQILHNYVTNTSENVFVLRNLPEVIKGALFSRYSRSTMGLRSLLLKEFIQNEEMAFSSIVGKENIPPDEQVVAIQKAQNFYDRILDGYGDDSIGELGGAHLALENISMLAAKVIEDCRIGGSPLEKSTRYIYFDQKVKGEYLFYKEPVIMTSAFRDLYIETCNHLFETYSELIPPMTALMEQKYPKEPHISKAAYTASVRAKVLDCLRGLLPSSTLTNVGMFGNGRFFEQMIKKLSSHSLAEMQELSKACYGELHKVMPSFIRRSDPQHPHYQSFIQFQEQMRNDLRRLAETHEEKLHHQKEIGVHLIHHDAKCVSKIAAALLFPYTLASLEELQELCEELPEEEIARILDAAALSRENRRHKSPRALEEALFTFEIVADFGIYRDLQRHRILSQERQLLTCDFGYYIPSEMQGTEMEKEYVEAMDKAKGAFDLIAQELPEEAQYIVPMAFHLRWYITVNLRSLQWLCELRSSPAGHISYRYVAQEMARQVSEKYPSLERFFKFVDYNGYQLGRMGQEVRRVQKKRGE